MRDCLIHPFGFLRPHLLRQAALRGLNVMPASGPGAHRLVAIGVGGACEEHADVDRLLELLPGVDRACLFTGMNFERGARRRSHAALLSLFHSRGVAVDVIDQEAALGGLGPDASMFDAMERISATLLDRALAS